MKVAIDARMLNILNDRAGLYQYTVNLINNLVKTDTDNRYRILCGFRPPIRVQQATVLNIPGKLSYFCLEKLRMYAECLVGKVDIFHSPFFYLPECKTAKTVITIHDLMVFKHPEFLSQSRIKTIQKQITSSVKSADAIIVVSEFTRKELIDFFGIAARRIKVILNGISDRFGIENTGVGTGEIKKKYKITKPYLLFVGNIEPKKNIPYLIRAFKLFRERFKYHHQLVIVGNKGWGFSEVLKLALDLGLEEEVLFPGVVSDEDLPELYRGADLFVFPSLFEGFGIPVIEAMACGTPVITSGNTSLAEVVDTAAIFFDPTDIEDLAEKMNSVLNSGEIRNNLIEKGLARSKMFSWKKCAQQTIQLYHELI